MIFKNYYYIIIYVIILITVEETTIELDTYCSEDIKVSLRKQ